MLRYDQNTAECFVYTYKEGVLSAVAHDLKLRVGAFWLTVDPQDSAVSASFDPNSIEVVCAMVNAVMLYVGKRFRCLVVSLSLAGVAGRFAYQGHIANGLKLGKANS